MLADTHVTLHTIASQDMWGLRELDNDGIKLRPRILPDQVKISPEKVFKITRCSCLVIHCKNSVYSCVQVNLKFTNFCECN